MRKVALVGFGYWGKNLARVFHALGALGMICDVNRLQINEAQKHYPNVQRSDSLEETLGQEDIQGVVIATPPASHKALALKSLLAGKDIFVEKPLALNFQDGSEIYQCALKHKRILMVGHVFEYHPAVLKLKAMIEKGKLGKIHYVYSQRLNSGRVRTEENVLWSFAPHDIAILGRLLKIEPETVACVAGLMLNNKLPDTTLTTLHFKTGVMAHIFVSWMHPFKAHHTVFVGDKQTAVFDDTEPWNRKLVLYPHRAASHGNTNSLTLTRRSEGLAIPIKEEEPLKTECRQFLKSMKSRRPPLTDGLSALRVLRVLEAAQTSMTKQGEPVYLSCFSHQPGRKNK